MRTSIKLFGLLILTAAFVNQSFAASTTYDQLVSSLKSTGIKLNLPDKQTFENFDRSKKRDIPSDLRPERTAKATISIKKLSNEISEDGTSYIKEEILCQRIVFLNVYKSPESSEVSMSDLSKLFCWDFYYKDNAFASWDVNIGGFMNQFSIENDPDLAAVMSGEVKAVSLFLYPDNIFVQEPIEMISKSFTRESELKKITNIDDGSQIKLPDFVYSGILTSDLNNKSLASMLRHNAASVCTMGDIEVGSKSQKEKEECQILNYDVAYEAAIHVEDDQL